MTTTSALTVPPGWHLIARDDVGSTNDEMRGLAEGGAADRTVLVARRQLAGRGRRGHRWASPEGNLYSSILLRPEGSLARVGQLTFVVCLAVADAVATVAPTATVQLKWPNDVLVNGGKIAGILLESADGAGGGAAWVIIGTGVNLTSHPEDTETPATDLATAIGTAPSVSDVLRAYLTAIDHHYGIWLAGDFAAIRAAWLQRSIGQGQPIRVRTARETLVGRFAALDETGALILDLGDGGRRTITAGDVFFGGRDAAGH